MMGSAEPCEAFGADDQHLAGTRCVLDVVSGGSEMTVPFFPGLPPERPGAGVYRGGRLPRLLGNQSR